MNEKEALIALASFIPFGPVRINLLLSFFGSAKKTWNAKGGVLRQVGLSPGKVESFLKYRNDFNPRAYFSRINREGVTVLTKDEKVFPQNLKDIEDCPTCLYIKGRLAARDKNAVAIVGSRKATIYGKEIAFKFSAELARSKMTIVSGLARGIDTQAHKAALSVGARTLAVLGSGLDSLYPPENLELSQQIIKHGAILSEYPLGYPVKPTNFANRNRIISGLSKGVVVIEGEQKSGTLLTASRAAEQGRTVFAVPGPITSPLSAAPHFLISRGAKLVTSAKDILEDIDIQI